MVEGKLTVYFDESFWVGVFEKTEDGMLSVCRVVFGKEPTDSEVWDFVLRRYSRLKFRSAVRVQKRQTAENPKRRQRNVKKQMRAAGIGTKAQQAIAAGRKEQKSESQIESRRRREEEKQHRYELKKEKRREKHRGH